MTNPCPTSLSELPLQYQPNQMNQATLMFNGTCTTNEGSTNGQQYFVYNSNSDTKYTTCATSPDEAIINVQNLPLNTSIFSGSQAGGNTPQCLLIPIKQTNVGYIIYKQ